MHFSLVFRQRVLGVFLFKASHLSELKEGETQTEVKMHPEQLLPLMWRDALLNMAFTVDAKHQIFCLFTF